MDWVCFDFCDRVYHLLYTSSIKGLQEATSSRTWRGAAEYHLGKRKNVKIFSRFAFDSSLNEVKENAYARITTLDVESDDFERRVLDTLPYFTTDDDSQFKLGKLEKTLHLQILHEIQSIGCFFTVIEGFPYLSALSREFLKKQIDREMLKKVILSTGWRQQHVEIIKNLIIQNQLVKFCSVASSALQIDLKTIQKLIEVTRNGPRTTRSVKVNANCSVEELKTYLEETGFEERAMQWCLQFLLPDLGLTIFLQGRRFTLTQRPIKTSERRR